ncbi:hypothetical protein [Enterococcus caccae]
MILSVVTFIIALIRLVLELLKNDKKK